jgi:hypothetical protein
VWLLNEEKTLETEETNVTEIAELIIDKTTGLKLIRRCMNKRHLILLVIGDKLYVTKM